jgi:hypothetical protein
VPGDRRADRQSALRSALEAEGLDGLVVTHLPNLFRSGGHRDNGQNGVARVCDQPSGRRNAQQSEEEDDNREFKDDGDAQNDVDKEIEIGADGDHRLYVNVLADTKQEDQPEAESYEIGEETAGDKEGG